VKGGALPRLAVELAALAPVAGVAWLGAEWSRARLADPARVRTTLDALGIATRGRTLTCRPLGRGNMNAVVLVTLTEACPSGGRAPERIVLKRMLRFGTLLGWGGRELGTMREHPRPIDRTARWQRELAVRDALVGAVVRVPRCLGASAALHALALEWIDGDSLSSALARGDRLAGALGALLARMHAHGIAMGDANPNNLAVTASGELVPFDLETAHAPATARQQGFDLAWAAAFLPDARAHAELADAYGPVAAPIAAARAAAQAHLDRYWPLVDVFARRWRRAA
jgi:hypothetical protein